MGERKHQAEGRTVRSFEDVIGELSSADFDGHTEFDRLNYTERLLWLSQAAQFFWTHSRGAKQKMEAGKRE